MHHFWDDDFKVKKKDPDDLQMTLSYNSLDGNEIIENENFDSVSKFTEANEQNIPNEILSKPKTMKNNCVNLKCLDNTQKLVSLKERYNELEKKYFHLVNSGSKRCKDFEELLRKKENEQKNLQKMKSIYLDKNIKDLDYFSLKDLEAKIMRSLDSIQAAKQKLYVMSTKSTIYSKKTCVICYEGEIKVLVKPCRHLCICEKCSPKIESCPLCREPIRERERVKYSYNY